MVDIVRHGNTVYRLSSDPADIRCFNVLRSDSSVYTAGIIGKVYETGDGLYGGMLWLRANIYQPQSPIVQALHKSERAMARFVAEADILRLARLNEKPRNE